MINISKEPYQTKIFWFDEKNQLLHEFIYDNCDSNLTIRDLLYDVLLHFKTTLKAKNIILIIKNIDQGFTLHVPKRNGKPNEDFPAFDFKVSLSQTKQSQFSLKIEEKYIQRQTSENLALKLNLETK